jgi:hypothetical protein
MPKKSVRRTKAGVTGGNFAIAQKSGELRSSINDLILLWLALDKNQSAIMRQTVKTNDANVRTHTCAESAALP